MEHDNNNRTLVIKWLNYGERQILKFLLSGQKAFVNFDEDLWFISSIINLILFYFVEEIFWLEPGTFVAWRRLPSYKLKFRDSFFLKP